MFLCDVRDAGDSLKVEASVAYTVQAVPAKILIEAHEVVIKNHGSGRDPMISIIVALAKRYEHKQLADAIMRLQAMTEIVAETDKSAWIVTVPNKDYKLINKAVLRAAARAPLIKKKKNLKFDPQGFLKIALEESEIEGSA
jgi:hypothetical protein